MKKTRHPSARVRTIAGDDLPEPLQQVDRTCVLHRGRKLAYFAGCDYFRLASHPRVLQAIHHSLDEHGLNVAASRKTTGHHPLYEKLETELARFFGVESAVMLSNGYLSNLAVAQALAGEFQHVLVDERAHGSVQDAVAVLGVPVTTFAHRDVDSARKLASRLLKRSSRRATLLLATDGLFSHSGEVAPLDEYLELLPSNVTLLVDDAHGAGTLGKSGRGTPEHLGLKPQPRLIHTVTLSKAFGVYGGAVLGPDELRQRIIARSRLFAGNTPLPLPLVSGVIAALGIIRDDPQLRRRLCFNTRHLKAALRAAGIPVNDGPGPIIPLHPRNGNDVARLKRNLINGGIHPPYINYLGGPNDGYFRFVVSCEHTTEQLDALIHALTKK